MATSRFSSSIWRSTGLVIAVLILGFPLAIVFTHGTILIPLLIVMVLGPLGIINYLLWGWWLSPRNEGGEERNQPAFDRKDMPSISNSEGVVSKEQKHGFFRR